MSWHATHHLLRAYARGEADHPSASSLEAHVINCATCRQALVALADGERLERVWGEIRNTVDAPRRGPLETLIVRLGVSDHRARLLAATPSLSASWLIAVALSLGFAALAAQQGQRGLLVFLVVAALLPLAGVAAAYGPGIDPTYEIGVVAPMSGFHLVLVRAAAVLAGTAVLAGLAALTLPHVGWMAAAWLVPSLALTVLSLAFATVVPPLVAAGSVGLVWTAIVAVSARVADDRLVAFGPRAQIGLLVLAAASGLVLAHRRDSFDLGSHV